MRKLLYLAAGAALLSAPAAFAQNDSTTSNQPSPAMSSSAATDGQAAGSTDAQGDAAQAPAQDPPSDAQAAGSTDAQSDAAQAPAQVSPSDAQAPDPQAPANAPPPDQAAPPDQSAASQGAPPPPPPGDQSQYAPASQPSAEANQGSRLYVQQGEYQGQGIQVISNAPVPDTLMVRHLFPPLSRAGRRTAPAGN